MPNCFRLYPKGETDAAILQNVDAAICLSLGMPVDPKYWVCGWFHCIGFLLATTPHKLGSTELRNEVMRWFDAYNEQETPLRATMLRILDYLEQHYTSDAWVEIGKR